MHNIIFLDIDGVLNSMDYLHSLILNKTDNTNPLNSYKVRDDYGQLFDPRCVNWLDYIISKTNAKLVISSTWRTSGIIAMKELWTYRNLPGEIIDVTPRTIPLEFIKKYDSPNADRGYEIQYWLDNNKNLVNSYVILDDEDDMLPAQNFVKCDSNIGLNYKNTRDAILILNNRIH
jgi:hypothetical protein